MELRPGRAPRSRPGWRPSIYNGRMGRQFLLVRWMQMRGKRSNRKTAKIGRNKSKVLCKCRIYEVPTLAVILPLLAGAFGVVFAVWVVAWPSSADAFGLVIAVWWRDGRITRRHLARDKAGLFQLASLFHLAQHITGTPARGYRGAGCNMVQYRCWVGTLPDLGGSGGLRRRPPRR